MTLLVFLFLKMLWKYVAHGAVLCDLKGLEWTLFCTHMIMIF